MPTPPTLDHPTLAHVKAAFPDVTFHASEFRGQTTLVVPADIDAPMLVSGGPILLEPESDYCVVMRVAPGSKAFAGWAVTSDTTHQGPLLLYGDQFSSNGGGSWAGPFSNRLLTELVGRQRNLDFEAGWDFDDCLPYFKRMESFEGGGKRSVLEALAAEFPDARLHFFEDRFSTLDRIRDLARTDRREQRARTARQARCGRWLGGAASGSEEAVRGRIQQPTGGGERGRDMSVDSPTVRQHFIEAREVAAAASRRAGT